ncbi:MAG TPA: hypothetical protein VNC60_00290 [Actinomycetota bacterium]|nr:hypothetical protein [Actinomycetota bacterium]
MDVEVPFCQECGRVGARMSGLHPGDAGIVRWTLFTCGHVTTRIELEDPLARDDGSMLPDAASAT